MLTIPELFIKTKKKTRKQKQCKSLNLNFGCGGGKFWWKTFHRENALFYIRFPHFENNVYFGSLKHPPTNNWVNIEQSATGRCCKQLRKYVEQTRRKNISSPFQSIQSQSPLFLVGISPRPIKRINLGMLSGEVHLSGFIQNATWDLEQNRILKIYI